MLQRLLIRKHEGKENVRYDKNKGNEGALDALIIERDAQAAEILLLQDALKSIRQYGKDTLLGPHFDFDDTRDWQRQCVRRMTELAILALEY